MNNKTEDTKPVKYEECNPTTNYACPFCQANLTLCKVDYYDTEQHGIKRKEYRCFRCQCMVTQEFYNT